MLLQNLRYALRLLTRRPSFTLIAVSILGLGIAVNAAMFSVLNTLLFHAVPYRDAARILALYQANPERGLKQQLVSIPDYLDWRLDASAFDGLAAWNFQFFNLSSDHQPERVQGLKVTADFFRILGMQSALGGDFTGEHERPGNDQVVILSDGLWKRRFGGDSGIVGRSILIENEPHVVIGVLPGDFHLFRVLNRELELFVPLVLNPARATRADHLMFVYAKLKPHVTLAQARLLMDAITSRVATEHPDTSAGWRAELVQLKQQWTSGSRTFLVMAQVAMGFVLLLACANVAGLKLAYAVGRRKETAIRIALGASRPRLIGQMLIESSVLAALSTVAGTALAFGLIGALNRLPYNVLNRVEPFRLDEAVLAFSTAAGLVAGMLAGLAPALQASTLNLKPGILRGRRTHEFLIASQAALAVVLLTGAGLLVRSSLLVSFMNRGLDPHHLWTAQVWLPAARYPDAARIARFWRTSVERVAALPGVQSASAVNFLPLSVLGTTFGVQLEGQAPVRPGEEPQVQLWVIGPDYFHTMSFPLLAGRSFTEQDDDEAHGVVIVSAAMARRFWPGQSALGKHLRPMIPDSGNYWLPQSKNRLLTVVGIAGDVKLDGVTQNPLPQIYVPYAQNPSAIFHLVVRTAADPGRLSAAVRQAVFSIDPDQPVFDEKTLEEVLANSTARASTTTSGLAMVAAIALLLACAGIYGTTAYVVSQRSRESAIRMALGANPRRLVGLQMRRTMLLVLAGSATGISGALAGTPVLKSLLVGIATTDVVTLTAAPLLFVLVATLATWLPARRAARVDPLTALRHD